MDIINAQGINHSYIVNQEEIKTLKDISLNINKGDFAAIVGKNGCGKSTLAKHFNALIPLQTGTLTVASLDCKSKKNLYKIRNKCTMVFQNPDSQFVSSVVKEDIEFSLNNYNIKQNENTVSEILDSVGLNGFENRDIFTLSGGQKQRLALAEVLSVKPDIIILDEATTMLSPRSRKSVIDTVKKIHNETDITIIMITQYAEETVDCDRLIVMDSGRIVANGSPKEIYSNNDIIKNTEIGVPYCVKVYSELKENGINLGECPLSNERLVELLCRLK